MKHIMTTSNKLLLGLLLTILVFVTVMLVAGRMNVEKRDINFNQEHHLPPAPPAPPMPPAPVIPGD